MPGLAEKPRKHQGKAKKPKKPKIQDFHGGGGGDPLPEALELCFLGFFAFPRCFLAFSGVRGGEQCWEGLAEKQRKHKGKAKKTKKQKSKTSMGEGVGTHCQKSWNFVFFVFVCFSFMFSWFFWSVGWRWANVLALCVHVQWVTVLVSFCLGRHIVARGLLVAQF